MTKLPGAVLEHCCQNELCPIDCVRCDGNETDKKLLSYEKPPVFVPIILAVLKAQLRREKVELSYRFPDRNCFSPVTSISDKGNQPSYDVMGVTTPGTTTTETPVWLQLLLKLKESFGTTPTTTTTTEIPVWKLLLNKLKSEQNGNNSPVTSWSKVDKTTTPAYQASQTPPWRRTARLPTTTTRTETTKLTTTAIRDQTTSKTTQPTTAEIKEKATTTIGNEIATEMTQQTSTKIIEQSTTDIRKQTTSEKSQIPTTEIKEQITEHTTEKELPPSTDQSFPTGVPVTIKETVFFTTPKQKFVTQNKQQEVVTQLKQEFVTQNKQQEIVTQNTQQELVTKIKQQEIVTQNEQGFVNQSKQLEIVTQRKSQNVLDTISTKVYPRSSSEHNLSTKPTDSVSSIESTTSVPEILMRNNKDITVTRSEHSNGTAYVNVTTVDNVGITKLNLNRTKHLESNESLTVEDISTVSQFASIGSTTGTPNVSIETDHYNHKQEPKQGFRNKTETNDLTTPRLNTEPMTVVSHMQITDVTEEKEYVQHNTSNIISVTTELPLHLLTDLGVTISTEFAKTVTEAETPAPLQERVIPRVPENELLKTNITEIKIGFNDTLVSLNNSLGTVDSEISHKTDFSNPSTDIIKEHDNGQIYVNTSSFINGATEKHYENGKSSSLNYSLSNQSDSNLNSDLSAVSKLIDILLANYTKSNVSLLSGNLTSSDFIYPRLETKFAVQNNTDFNYSVLESNVRELVLYDSSHTKDTIQNYNATENIDQPFSVSIVESQEKISNTLKDKVATPSIEMSPENEVRIILGKLNALVSKNEAPSNFTPQPVLREVSQAQTGTTMVQHIATETPSLFTQPATRAPITHFQERTPVIQPVTAPQVQSATMTPLPWWQQTTLSPFSLDNLFGFTTPPQVGQDWFNPTTSAYAWDAMFGAGGVPVSQEATVPSYNANQDILNNIYDPLRADTQIPEASLNQLVQHAGSVGVVKIANAHTQPADNFGQEITANSPVAVTDGSSQVLPPSNLEQRIDTNQPLPLVGVFGQGITINPLFQPTSNFGQGINTKPGIPSTDYDKQSTGPKNSVSESNKPATKTHIPQAKQPTTQEPPLKGFDIFNTFMDSMYPGNFSIIAKSKVQTTVSPTVQTTTKVSSESKRFIETTTSNPPESIPTKSIAFSPITFPQAEVSNGNHNAENISSTEITTKRTFLPSEKLYTPAISSANKQDVKIVYDVTTPRPVTPRIPVISTKFPLPPMTSVVTNFWFTRKPVKETSSIPVTDPIPVRPVTDPIPVMPVTHPIQVTPVTTPVPVTPVTNITPVPRAITQNTASFWNPNSNRVLPTDTISSWWAQVQPTTPPPAYAIHQTPTPTPVASLDQCYQTQDPTGFCQSRYSGHYKNPSDCRSFYVCIWGFLYSCACPPNTMFDDKIDVCNWDHLVTCTKQV
ncbi:mucin-17-like [Mercenaria mercenaria]|uniref:mucin-17-like n=1 Tax=Mercenaria mercenaria TaxID=6596 RepID=UPI00234E8364|nr:mucin-17-like [Mercenaria mercenaria]